MLISTAYAQAAGGASDGGMIMQLMPLVLIFAVFYFLLIRPQQKKAKEHKAMIAAVRRGDKVVTAGGVFGKVTKVQEDDRVTVEIADGIRIDVVGSTISNVIARSEAPANDSKKSSTSSDKDRAPATDGGGIGSRLGSLLGGKKKSD